MPDGASSLIRQDVLPVGVGYLLVMGALALGVRLARREGDPVAAGRGGRRGGARTRWPRLARQYAGTVIGGYLLLMAVVVLYYYAVARVGGGFITSAFTGCALLIALSTPVYALASWLTERRRSRAGQRPADPHPGP